LFFLNKENKLAKDIKREIEENGVEDLLIEKFPLNHDPIIKIIENLKVTRIEFNDPFFLY